MANIVIMNGTLGEKNRSHQNDEEKKKQQSDQIDETDANRMNRQRKKCCRTQRRRINKVVA